jgi:hypothetical protein
MVIKTACSGIKTAYKPFQLMFGTLIARCRKKAARSRFEFFESAVAFELLAWLVANSFQEAIYWQRVE